MIIEFNSCKKIFLFGFEIAFFKFCVKIVEKIFLLKGKVMENIFNQKISRRNFINTSAKVFAAYSALGIFSDATVEAKRKKNSPPEVAPEPEKKFVDVQKFLTLEEMNIGRKNLQFDEMETRFHTGAIVIHHSGLLRGDVDSTLEDIHRMHKEKRHWSGIGYHFLIHKDGFAEYARPLECQGAHTFKNNEFTVGICLAGNYQFGEPPTPQLQTAVQIVSALCDRYNFQPTDTTIFGHRDLGKTACPGRNLYALLPDIIKSSQKVLDLK